MAAGTATPGDENGAGRVLAKGVVCREQEKRAGDTNGAPLGPETKLVGLT